MRRNVTWCLQCHIVRTSSSATVSGKGTHTQHEQLAAEQIEIRCNPASKKHDTQATIRKKHFAEWLDTLPTFKRRHSSHVQNIRLASMTPLVRLNSPFF